ncbi:hypothetical protein R8N45_08345 [Vibrio sp. 1403]|uniref:hypothetical protein n=1 Tax=Vibrio TaxID=662 RepID=UPI001A8EF8D7|nr:MULTISPECIES: hypothetical protein [Vibrio]MBO0197776.1 hypothetical protein [Vibrio alginolyticus]MDW3078531.1 hypothetical protein [Vibrio sp. 1403]
MKPWLKIGTVVAPVPFVFFVYKGDHPIWVKILSTLWTAFMCLLYLGIAISPDSNDLSHLLTFNIMALLVFFACNGLLTLFKKSVQKTNIENTISSQPKGPETKLERKPVSKSSEHANPIQPTQTNSSTVEPSVPQELLTPRREKALYKLANQVLEDDVVDLDESKKLRSWFKRYPESKQDPKTKELAVTVELYLEDKVLDNDEALHLFALLTDFCDGFEEREQANQKPKKKPAPKSAKHINVDGSSGLSFLNELELGTQYLMNYKDSAGKVSDREIVLRKIEQNASGDTYVKAFCLMRNSVRTFRADRITGICSVETGEVFV